MALPFSKVLIANRGEIAVRITRACRELGLKTVAVYSEADAQSLHVRHADESVLIGKAASKESYLAIDRILDAARHTGAEAIHPGYGFLSENEDFAEAVTAAGFIFVGPPSSAIRAMGLKTEALRLMRAASVPTVPGYDPRTQNADPTPDSFRPHADRIGYPVLIKAAAGGGGKGMRIVRSADELDNALDSAQREAQNAFGDASVFLEKYIEQGRHIEFQVFADSHGNVVHLFERECSIQRRHQKIVEESPSPLLDVETRARMGQAAVEAARAVGYVNAGTVEFIVDGQRNFYFLEMNTRLQVEHPVTEWVTGLDLVKLQFRVAGGESLPFTQADLTQRGHAIECRVYAEDPANNFLPDIGTLTRYEEPIGPGIRVDSGVRAGDAISLHYDPMISKLSVYGSDRAEAIDRALTALGNYHIGGVITNIPFLRDVLDHGVFRAGAATTGFIDQYLAGWVSPPTPNVEPTPPPSTPTPTVTDPDPWARADGFRLGGGINYTATQEGSAGGSTKRAARIGSNTLTAVMPGLVTKILVAEGDRVTKGQTLLTLEAMKMEVRVNATADGQVKAIRCTAGQVVERGSVLVEMGA
jgi:acetyl-CoA carboxylase biotin carboxylase subunit